jgi:NAD+ diphosphatase
VGPITFSGATLDRVAERRSDEAFVLGAWQDPRARAIVVSRAGVGLDGDAPQPGEDAWDGGTGETLAPRFQPLDDREAILLGVLDGDVPLWVVEATEDEALVDLRAAAPVLRPEDAGLLAYAQQLVHWRTSHRFCGTCGEPTAAQEAGHVRTCPNGHTTHPRTDPVVIMLVTDGDRLLLGRQAAWPAGRYSALAGFVEPGEALEEAVAREVLEESGVTVGRVDYVSSQPWPFPASLMLGFTATYERGEPTIGDAELQDVRWFERAEIVSAAAQPESDSWGTPGDAGGPLALPPRLAIARRLIEHWLAA